VLPRHLKVLLSANIVAVQREGRRRIYAIDGQAILRRFGAILEQARSLASVCCPADR